jgi:hypothetical protein
MPSCLQQIEKALPLKNPWKTTQYGWRFSTTKALVSSQISKIAGKTGAGYGVRISSTRLAETPSLVDLRLRSILLDRPAGVNRRHVSSDDGSELRSVNRSGNSSRADITPLSGRRQES